MRNQAALNLTRILHDRDQALAHLPMRVACQFCDWHAEGPAGQMRDLQHAHRLEHVTPKVSRRKPRGQWNINHAGLHDNIARARAEGAARWTDGEAA